MFYPLWLVVLAWAALVLAGLSAALVGLDITRHRQAMTVMEITWPVTALYLGPLGLWAYQAFGREGVRPHKSFRQRVFVSATHCGGGCTLGDILSENALAAHRVTIAQSPLITMFVCDFVAAYAIGILFQYWPIRASTKLTRGRALRAAIQADTLSLVAFEAGLFGWMALVHPLIPRPSPQSPVFWFAMQIGMAVGFLTTLPANAWLVRAGIKGAL